MRYTRNPLYLGTLVVAAGLVAAARNAWLAAVFALVFLLVYLPVIQLEQQHLRRLFPEYAAYAREVPALAPRLTPLRPERCANLSLEPIPAQSRISGGAWAGWPERRFWRGSWQRGKTGLQLPTRRRGERRVSAEKAIAFARLLRVISARSAAPR